ncbi:NarK family nitrate/nitrite MFS transporter [Geomesophilobacter sediminis]|uniref:Nitrate/nitrite transporter n=1 Tax=Geomesophilobacter sediminis TaxID=2798584 RepID=A0A8J7M1V0_9BACT|nr:NarK family nitrate/nitrite MFS transporter [Geomesophilobacter sediminis]MBJ6727148.1 NarK family nitrate/nitrite MFS transporter [Geomesophilobacter sediminis]
MFRPALKDWNPEDPAFWEQTGKRIASRNLWISIPCLFLSFAVWMVWSVVVVNLESVGFGFDPDKLFWLTALPGLSGATLRIFYAFMVPIFGGRTWTTITTASLLIPAIGIGFAVRNPHSSYLTMLVLALLCGLGGANFASSMSNISFFYPKAQKGAALGLNAGLGNLGVSAMQFVIPLVTTTAMFSHLCGEPQLCLVRGTTRTVWMQNAGFFWVPFIIAATAAAWLGMDNLANVRASFREQAVIFRRKHNWIMCWIYLGTFGSFIGYSAALPLLIKSQFPGLDPMRYAFLGPLLGALVRPVGGWIADKIGGARVTFWDFIVMSIAVLGVLHYLPGPGNSGNFTLFLASFILIFIATGIGNGSTFSMIPVIFLTERQRAAAGQGAEGARRAVTEAGKEAAAVLGFSSAFAAYGAFFIPKAFGSSITLSGRPDAAFYGFLAFYLSCIVLTWYYYARKGAPIPC